LQNSRDKRLLLSLLWSAGWLSSPVTQMEFMSDCGRPQQQRGYSFISERIG